MPENKKVSYPMLPPKNWWMLRKRFQQSIPAKVTAGYLSTVLGITEKSAQANVLPFLKALGIIDEEEKPTQLANKWRFDENYKEVCDTILKEVYPQELLDALPGPIDDKTPVERWFANKTGFGARAAGRMANLYVLISEADPTKTDVAPKPRALKTTPKKTKAIKSGKSKVLKLPKEAIPEPEPTVTFQSPTISNLPSIHIDVQIHLSPESPPEQIDKVFESIAKHLKALYGHSKKTS